MSRGQKVIIALVLSIFILGGLNMWKSIGEKNTKQENEKEETTVKEPKMNAYEQENYVPIQEYTGEGFTLRDANPKVGEIAEANRDEVIQSVEEFFLSDYKTEVQVHNIVTAIDGVSVFVESIGEPHFYAFAIVPVDVRNEIVRTDEVWSQEGQVESAIRSGLYVMAYEEEFAKLDEFLEGIEAEYPVVGMNVEVAANVKGNGYNTAYYFTKAQFNPIYEEYLKNPEITKEEITLFLKKMDFDPTGMAITTIRFHMEKSGVDPDEKIYEEIFMNLENLKGIPIGYYLLILNDNYIDPKKAIAEKENTIDKTKRKKIEKR